MRSDILNNIKLALESIGYSLLDIGEANEENIYRPKLEDSNEKTHKPVSIKIDEAREVIYIYDFACSKEDDPLTILNINGEKSAKKVKISESELKKIKEEEAKRKEERIKKFLNKINSLANSGENSNELLSKKKIKMYGDAFISEHFSFDNKNNIDKPLIVKFSDIETNELVGAQVCFLGDDKKSKKYSVKGSTFKNAVCKLQSGERIPAINKTPTLLAESYTTACEVAEAMPKSEVYCTAGIGSLYDAGLSLKEKYPNKFIVLVLDKTKNNEKNAALSKLEESIKINKTPFIQISKNRREVLGMTDYNDYALKFGKTAVKSELELATRQWFPLQPEVLEGTGDTYRVVSSINNKVIEINKQILFKRYKELANEAFWDEFCKLNNAYTIKQDKEGNTKRVIDFDKIHEWLNLEEQRNSSSDVCGIGIFKDAAGYCLNSKYGKYILKDGKVESNFEMKPLQDKLYVKVKRSKRQRELKEKLTIDDLKVLYSYWDKTYDLSKSDFFGILGLATQAAFCSFTKHTAHMWLTGPTGSGKSFLINSFLNRLAGYFMLSTKNNTESGINQFLTDDDGVQNSTFVGYDEAGGETSKRSIRMEDIIALARDTAVDDEETVMLQGTSDQKGRVYKRKCGLVLASASEKLDDHQDLSRFLFLRMDNKIKLKYTEEFEEVLEGIEKYQDKFAKTVLLAAPHYNNMLKLVNKIVVKAVGNKQSKISHKTIMMTSVLAGMASLLKVIKGTDDKDIYKSIERNCKEFINKQIDEHLISLEENGNIINELESFIVIKDGDERSLLEELKLSPDEYWNTYGIALTKRGSLRIRKSNYALHRLVNNIKKAVFKIKNSKNRLIDAANSNDKVRINRAKTGNRQVTCFSITLENSLDNDAE